ncbi:MAG: DUF3821 domain-containing protein [Methanomicrobiales archaeon]|nr:DUF3821 domain-containing protein [Methanomicrobiales archaeon]
MSKRFIVMLGLVALMALVLPAAAVINNITAGDTIFIGEQNLDITNALNGATSISYYTTGQPCVDVAQDTQSVTNTGFYVSPAIFSSKTGAWYTCAGAVPTVAFRIQAPSLAVNIFNTNTTKSVNDGNIVRDQSMNIRVDSNVYLISTRAGFAPTDLTGDRFLVVKVRDTAGAVQTALFDNNGVATVIGPGIPTTNMTLGSQWFINGTAVNFPIWGTGYKQGTSFYYPAGTYEVWVETNANGMKDNLGAVTGQTVSAHHTVTISDNTVTITANTDTVVR